VDRVRGGLQPLVRSSAHTWVLCMYNAEGLPDPLREAVWRTHPEVVAGSGWHTVTVSRTLTGWCGRSRRILNR
jgi:hypothetical protein